LVLLAGKGKTINPKRANSWIQLDPERSAGELHQVDIAIKQNDCPHPSHESRDGALAGFASGANRVNSRNLALKIRRRFSAISKTLAFSHCEKTRHSSLGKAAVLHFGREIWQTSS